MIEIHRLAILAACTAAMLLASGCAYQAKKEEKAAEQMPVNCATADGDLRLLRSEKAHVAERVAQGVTAIYPAGLVVGLLTGTEGTKIQIATGEYNRKLDAKIAEIQSTCGVQ
ncbi:MAG: hypothetical protein ACREI8_03610 [Myxococcota bacterium]